MLLHYIDVSSYSLVPPPSYPPERDVDREEKEDGGPGR